MKFQNKIIIKISFIAILVSFFSIAFSFAYYEVDLTSYVTEVIDGDSFYIQGDEVRLADVSCPEWNEYGGPEATTALTNLIEGQIVYLDTDQKTGRDPYGRLVAVVYVEFNETHLLNVNAAMWALGFANLTDYTNNEFDPYTWTLFDYSAYIEPQTSPDIDTELLNAYTELYTEHETLNAEYNALLENYMELDARYNELNAKYNALLQNQETSSTNIPGFPLIALLTAFVFLIIKKRTEMLYKNRTTKTMPVN